MSQFNTPAAVESRGTSVERPFSFSFHLYTFLHLPPIHLPKSAPPVTRYQLPVTSSRRSREARRRITTLLIL